MLPGVWRLRLPLPWPGVPHCNAWALAAGDGVVLVDTGMHEPGSWEELDTAMRQCGLRIDDVRLVVCTHAHADHCGQAAPLKARTGAEIWMHADHGHMLRSLEKPEAQLERRVEVARASGVPEEPLRRWADERRGQSFGVAGPLDVDRTIAEGATIQSDLGSWRVIETPGHAPSHIALYQPEHRLLLSGDHVLGRVSLYFDYGYRPDPVGDFLASLDRVAGLDARLTLSGHGRPFTDLRGHVDGNRRLVSERLGAVLGALADGAVTPYEIARRIYGEWWTPASANWLLTKVLCFLAHLHHTGRIHRTPGADNTDTWAIGSRSSS